MTRTKHTDPARNQRHGTREVCLPLRARGLGGGMLQMATSRSRHPSLIDVSNHGFLRKRPRPVSLHQRPIEKADGLMVRRVAGGL